MIERQPCEELVAVVRLALSALSPGLCLQLDLVGFIYVKRDALFSSWQVERLV